jgi:signal transduction histidine kinase
MGILILLASGLLSNSYGQKNKRKELITQVRLMERSSGFSPRDTAYVDLVNKLAREMRYYNADSLHLLAEKGLKLSRQTDYPRGESLSNMYLAQYYSDRGNSDSAITYFRKGLELASKIGADELYLSILNCISGEYEYQGDYARALNGYLLALERAVEQEELLLQSVINENIANLYASQKYYDESLQYYDKVRRLNDSLGNEIAQAETMSNLASVYADMDKLEYAMFNVNRSIDIFEKQHILDWLAFAYETKGKVYLKKYNYNWALYWYHQSEMLHRELDDDRARIDLYNGMAEAHFGLENDSLAAVYATDAFKISNKINFVEGTQKCARTLYNIYRNKQDYATALAYHELYQELSDSLSRNENKQSLSLLKTKTEYERQKEALIRENEKALAQQNRYIKVGTVLLLLAVLVIYLVLRSKKLQQQLNRELKVKHQLLEKRKTELQVNNETKTKLFSIIGHDLRGPIGALKDLLKMFKDGDISQEEFGSYMPKLRSDVDHIYLTLNNLLSWGHSQLNGSVTKPAVVSLQQIVSDNMKLLTEIAENKSIRIVNEIPAGTEVWSDPNQIDIVVRNLISNALKFTPENGMVTIRADEKEDHWVVSIRDTGVGMDRVTLQTIFEEKNNHSTYGTANEKGTGLGLALCKEMVEKNHGKIWVDSMLRKGSTFYFTLPKSAENYIKAV